MRRRATIKSFMGFSDATVLVVTPAGFQTTAMCSSSYRTSHFHIPLIKSSQTKLTFYFNRERQREKREENGKNKDVQELEVTSPSWRSWSFLIAGESLIRIDPIDRAFLNH